MGSMRVLLDLLGHLLRHVWGQDVHESGGCQLPHAVVLDLPPRQVGVGHIGEVIDGPDDGGHVLLEARLRYHILQVGELRSVHSPAPLKLVLTLGSHLGEQNIVFNQVTTQ